MLDRERTIEGGGGVSQQGLSDVIDAYSSIGETRWRSTPVLTNKNKIKLNK